MKFNLKDVKNKDEITKILFETIDDNDLERDGEFDRMQVVEGEVKVDTKLLCHILDELITIRKSIPGYLKE